MWKNGCKQAPSSLFFLDKGNKRWNTSLDCHLIPGGTQPSPRCHIEGYMPISKDLNLLKTTAPKYKVEAEDVISRIQDPLWHRVCVDILKVLGPAAFNDLWKSKLITVSSSRRRAYLACPNQSIVEIIEQYHFVIIAALKKFYPFLSSIETEISEDKREKTTGTSKSSVTIHRHFT